MSSASLDKARRASASEVADALVDHVCKAVAGIRFGSVELVIHEGRVVQIERRERVRLERHSDAETAG